MPLSLKHHKQKIPFGLEFSKNLNVHVCHPVSPVGKTKFLLFGQKKQKNKKKKNKKKTLKG